MKRIHTQRATLARIGCTHNIKDFDHTQDEALVPEYRTLDPNDVRLRKWAERRRSWLHESQRLINRILGRKPTSKYHIT